MAPSVNFDISTKGESPIIRPKIVSSAHDEGKILQSLNEIISPLPLMTIGTVRGETPYVCAVVFAYDHNLCLIFFSEKSTDHSQNLTNNKRIAGEIVDTHQTWESPRRGIQFQGTAHEATSEELSSAVELYMSRFPGFERSKIDPKTNQAHPIKVTPYIVRPTTIKIFDEKIFGRETWAVVNLPDECALGQEQ